MPALHLTEVVPLASLKFHPRNYRRHPDSQLTHIVKSIEQHGVYRPVVVAEDLTILAGAGLVQALRFLQVPQVQIVRVPIAHDDPRALKLLVGDNEISRTADDNDRGLSTLLRELMGNDPAQLLGTGYTQEQLAAYLLITRPESEIADLAAAEAWAGMGSYDEGGKPLQMIVSFRTPAARVEFLKLIGQARYTDKTLSTWYPPEERSDMAAVEFQDADDEAAG